MCVQWVCIHAHMHGQMGGYKQVMCNIHMCAMYVWAGEWVVVRATCMCVCTCVWIDTQMGAKHLQAHKYLPVFLPEPVPVGMKA